MQHQTGKQLDNNVAPAQQEVFCRQLGTPDAAMKQLHSMQYVHVGYMHVCIFNGVLLAASQVCLGSKLSEETMELTNMCG